MIESEKWSVCSACSGIIHREEARIGCFHPKKGRGAIFTKAARKRPSISSMKEEAAWAFRPVRLNASRLGGVQSQGRPGSLAVYLIARRDEDIWCPMRFEDGARTRV